MCSDVCKVTQLWEEESGKDMPNYICRRIRSTMNAMRKEEGSTEAKKPVVLTFHSHPYTGWDKG